MHLRSISLYSLSNLGTGLRLAAFVFENFIMTSSSRAESLLRGIAYLLSMICSLQYCHLCTLLSLRIYGMGRRRRNLREELGLPAVGEHILNFKREARDPLASLILLLYRMLQKNYRSTNFHPENHQEDLALGLLVRGKALRRRVDQQAAPQVEMTSR